MDEIANLPSILATIREATDDAWPEIDVHPTLDADQKAEVTQHFEDIEDAVAEIRRILGVSSENDT